MSLILASNPRAQVSHLISDHYFDRDHVEFMESILLRESVKSNWEVMLPLQYMLETGVLVDCLPLLTSHTIISSFTFRSLSYSTTIAFRSRIDSLISSQNLTLIRTVINFVINSNFRFTLLTTITLTECPNHPTTHSDIINRTSKC